MLTYTLGMYREEFNKKYNILIKTSTHCTYEYHNSSVYERKFINSTSKKNNSKHSSYTCDKDISFRITDNLLLYQPTYFICDFYQKIELSKIL